MSMDISAYIGQLFILGFQGQSPETCQQIIDDISLRNLGGVVFFDRYWAGQSDSHNIICQEQLRHLISHFQNHAASPLLIGIDQEGGKVRRLKPARGFPELPSAKSMAEDPTFSVSKEQAQITAHLLHDIGFNLNFAPVADLDCIQDNPIIGKLERSFSNSPEIVTQHCRIWLQEQRKASIFGCLKHFPGHGSSRGDSHQEFIDISNTWSETELLPYSTLISEGIVDIIMTGHLFNSHLDPTFPATLSKAVLADILRNRLHFSGLIISDDMQMQGIISRFGILDAIVLALAAGIDMIIVGNNLKYEPNLFQAAIRHIECALRQKKITEKRIVEAYNHVTQLKARLA